MKRVAIIQSSYIPWKGYFDIINDVDEFILLDNVQYTKRDWRNRNLIKTRFGTKWLSIPVEVKGKRQQRIDETRIADKSWAKGHWDALSQAYKTAKYYDIYGVEIHALYEAASICEYLSQVNAIFLTGINSLLGISTKLTWSTDYRLAEGKTERLVAICQEAGATEYVSGPSARAYLEQDLFTCQGISVVYKDYQYPEYEQLHPPFVHEVTVLDLLFSVGMHAPWYTWAWKSPSTN